MVNPVSRFHDINDELSALLVAGEVFDVRNSDANSQYIINESQAVVVAYSVLHIVGDHASALAEWFRIVRVGGYLLLTVPHAELSTRAPAAWAPDQKRHYTPALLIEEVEEALNRREYRTRMLRTVGADASTTNTSGNATLQEEVELVLQRIRSVAY